MASAFVRATFSGAVAALSSVGASLHTSTPQGLDISDRDDALSALRPGEGPDVVPRRWNHAALELRRPGERVPSASERGGGALAHGQVKLFLSAIFRGSLC